MTIIIGYKDENNGKVYIAGDGDATSGLDTMKRLDGKTFTLHGISYGFTSSYRMGQILKYHMPKVERDSRDDLFSYVVRRLVPEYRRILKEHGYKGEWESHNDLTGQFMITLGGRLFVIEVDFQVSEPLDDFYAIGCGYKYALGCLYQSKPDKNTDIKVKITEALNCACYFSAGCGGKYTFEENVK